MLRHQNKILMQILLQNRMENFGEIVKRVFVTVIKEPLFSLPIPCIRVWFCHDQLLFGQEEGRRLRFDDLRQSGKGTSLPIANFFFRTYQKVNSLNIQIYFKAKTVSFIGNFRNFVNMIKKQNCLFVTCFRKLAETTNTTRG